MSTNSNQIKTDRIVPNTPEKAANIRYRVPISLWLVENNHLFKAEKIIPYLKNQ
jgi:hypothetical protein